VPSGILLRSWSSRPTVRQWVLGLVTIAVLLLAYSRIRNADFIWDDDAHVTSNPTIVGPLGLKEIWTSGKANYFPLTMTSFWLQHAAWGLSPRPYHVVSILLHVAATLMLWQVLRQLQVPGAWLGAMLWALHPVQVESVAWISELKNTQSGFFYLLAAFFFVRWMQRSDPVRLSWDYGISLLAAVLAILSKSSTVMLPVVFGLLGWWRGHRRWSDAKWLTPFVAVSLLASGWTIWEQKVNSMASGAEWDHGLVSRLVIAGKVPWFYLGKLLWPDPLIFIYPRWDVNAVGVIHWIPLAGAVALGWILWRLRDGRGQPLFVALTYFFVSLFPVLGLFDVFFFRYSFVGDHFQYLASMGPLVLIGAGLVTLGNQFGAATPVKVGLGAATLLGALTALTWKQSGIYLNRESLWSDTVRLNPSAWIAQVNLGTERMNTGRPALAIPSFQAAVRLKTDDPLTEANWGVALIQLGRAQEAIPHLETAVRLMPKLAEAHNSLAVAFASLGRSAEAIAHAETAVRLKPDYVSARTNLGGYLMNAGRLNEALAHLEAGARIAPGEAAYQSAIGRVLWRLGRTEEAGEYFRAAVRMNPQNFDALSGLAEMLTRKGAYREALEYGAAALRVNPDSPDCRFIVGNALLLSGRAGEAINHFRRAVQLQPDYFDAQFNLALALEAAGRRDEAVAQYNQVLRMNAQYMPAQERLRRLSAPGSGSEAKK
jgi:tetratricopeptide (TPR) repeat protein